MTRVDRFPHVIFECVFDIKEDYFPARCHNVADDPLTQVESVDQQVPAKSGDLVGFFTLIQDQAQFFFAMRQLSSRDRFDAQQAL